MTPLISQRAIDMIVGFEISDAATYRATMQMPTWPGGASGPTIGIGYDLGYETRDQITADWSPHLAAATVQRLTWCAGIKADAARLAVTRLRDIVIPLEAAEVVFYQGDIPRYTAMTTRAFANCDGLSPDSLGAVVSLVFNRGTDIAVHVPDTRLEMRQIAQAMAARNYPAVPGFMRAMERLWIGKGLPGLIRRCGAQADLFEAGLGVSAAPPAPAGSIPTRAPAKLLNTPPAAAPPVSDADALDNQYNPQVPL